MSKKTILNKSRYGKLVITTLIIIVIFSIIIIRPKPDKPKLYIALGDSIASGYSTTSEEIYPSILFELLKNDGHIDSYYNMAEIGLTTSTMLEILKNMGKEDLKLFKNAYVITINIGGNNVLLPFLEYISNMKIISGSDNIRSGAEEFSSGARDIMSESIIGVRSAFSDTTNTNFNLESIRAGFRTLFTGLGTIATGAGEVLIGIPKAISTYRGTISTELEDILNNSVKTFNDEFVEIINWIDKNAPKATLIVNTVFNPFPSEILRLSVPFTDWVDDIILLINNIIIIESKNRGFLVSDVYSNLSNQLDLTNFNINPFTGQLSYDIIHLNDKGHRMIANLNYETFINNKKLLK